MNTMVYFLRKHWLKIVGAGLSIGGMAIDGIQHEKEMRKLKNELKSEIIHELKMKKRI